MHRRTPSAELIERGRGKAGAREPVGGAPRWEAEASGGIIDAGTAPPPGAGLSVYTLYLA